MNRWLLGVAVLALAVGCGTSTTSGGGSGGSAGSTGSVGTGGTAGSGGTASSSTSSTGSGGSATCPSYATVVAPILAAHCTSCHSASGSVSKVPLETYAEAAANADRIADQVASGHHATSLSADDEAALSDWAACGAPNN